MLAIFPESVFALTRKSVITKVSGYLYRIGIRDRKAELE